MEEKWIIQDWTGKRKFPDKTFSTFEDGWGFIRERFPNEEDWQEFHVIKADEPLSE
jgi:hypothetical protein